MLNFYVFADDTNTYYESDSLQELEKVINKELNKLNLWLNVNRLSLNIDKTNYIIFHPYNKLTKKRITIKINNKAINEKKIIKYLGVFYIKLEISNYKHIQEDFSIYWYYA